MYASGTNSISPLSPSALPPFPFPLTSGRFAYQAVHRHFAIIFAKKGKFYSKVGFDLL